MSTKKGSDKQHLIAADYHDVRLGIVASRFNSSIVKRLLESCLQSLSAAGVRENNIILLRVPGAFEIPISTSVLIARSNVDAVITLGAVIRGDTPHFDYICRHCSDGIGQVALETQVPVLFGVLTVDTLEQAMARAGYDGQRNQGADIAHAALEIISALRGLSDDRP